MFCALRCQSAEEFDNESVTRDAQNALETGKLPESIQIESEREKCEGAIYVVTIPLPFSCPTEYVLVLSMLTVTPVSVDVAHFEMSEVVEVE